MGKRDRSRHQQATTRYADQERQASQQRSDMLERLLMDRYSGAAARSDSLFDEARGGYSALANYQSPGGGSSYIRNWARNSIAPEAQARMRGGGVYDEFSRTGGLSAGDRGNIRARANSAVPSFFSAMRDNIGQRAAIQGGYMPGAGALMSRLGREQATAAGDTVLNTELGITDRVNEGRRWGAQGMTSSEQALQDLLARNLLQGESLASNIDQGEASIRAGGLAGLRGLRTDVPADLAYLDELLKAMGMGASERAALLGIRTNNTPDPPRDWLAMGLGAAGAIAPMFMGMPPNPGALTSGHSSGGNMSAASQFRYQPSQTYRFDPAASNPYGTRF